MNGGERQLELDRRELAEATLATAVVEGVLDSRDDREVQLLAALPEASLIEESTEAVDPSKARSSASHTGGKSPTTFQMNL